MTPYTIYLVCRADNNYPVVAHETLSDANQWAIANYGSDWFSKVQIVCVVMLPSNQ